jgi:hypothetical protein
MQIHKTILASAHHFSGMPMSPYQRFLSIILFAVLIVVGIYYSRKGRNGGGDSD